MSNPSAPATNSMPIWSKSTIVWAASAIARNRRSNLATTITGLLLGIHGGGTPGGRVIGQSTRDGGELAVEAQTNCNLISTILHTCFDVGQLRLQPALASG